MAYVLSNLWFAAGNTEGTASYAYVICILYVCAWKPSDLGFGGVTIQNKDGFNTTPLLSHIVVINIIYYIIIYNHQYIYICLYMVKLLKPPSIHV